MREIVNLLFVGLATTTMVAAVTMPEIHIGVLDQQTGPYEKQFMAYARDMYLDWLEKEQNNQICGMDVNFVFHRVDGQSDPTTLGKTAEHFMNGNWTRNYFTPANGFNNEPPQHELDIMFLGWSSALIPHALQGLKDAGIKKPVYAGGSSGTGAWFENADMHGTGRWDFAVNPQYMSDKEMAEILQFLKSAGATSILIMEEAGVGAYTEAVARGGRNAAKELGLEIVADVAIEWPCKFPKANDPAGCEEQNFAAIEAAIGDVVVKGKRKITADVFLGSFYAYACSHELKWFQENNINFGAYAMALCIGDATLRAINGDRHKFILGPTGWNGAAGGEHFDETFSTVQIYPEAEGNSAAAYAADFQNRYGVYPHYIDAWSFATWYYFHNDMITVNCDHTKLLDRMQVKRAPIPSFFGLLGSGKGGVNNFHKYLGTQIFPDDIGTPKIVAPAHLANNIGIYPCPTWHERDCWPDCVPCQFCNDLVASSVFIFSAVGAPFFMFAIIIFYWHFVLDFKVRNIWVDVSRMAFVMMNVASDIMAVLVLNAMMDEELLMVTDEYMLLLYLYVTFTVISVWCSIVRFWRLMTVIYWNIQNMKHGGLAASFVSAEARKSAVTQKVTNEAITACRQELAVTCLTCLICDIPIFAVQMVMLSYVMYQELVISLPLIWSMIFSAITIGSCSNSTVEFSLYRMISLLHKGSVEISWKEAVMLIVNPFTSCKNMGKVMPKEGAEVKYDVQAK